MNAQELKLKKDGFRLTTGIYASGSHYKVIMDMGRCFPGTKAQAKHFVSKRIKLDVLNGDDVSHIEYLLKKHGFKGSYKLTKSKSLARLQNHSDLYNALKLEYKL